MRASQILRRAAALVVGCATACGAGPTGSVGSQGAEPFPAGTQLAVRTDAGSASNSPEADCLRGPTGSDWRILNSHILDLGFDSRSHWLRVTMPATTSLNKSSSDAFDAFLVFQHHMVELVYYCAPDGVQRAGSLVPFPEWPQKLRFPAFRLRSTDESPVFYFRVRSDWILNFPLRLFVSLDDYLLYIQRWQIVQFSLLAIAVVVSLLYAGWFIISGRLMELYFGLLLITTSMTLFVVYGDAYIYLWPDSPATQRFAMKFTTALAAVCSCLFSRPLLKSHELPLLDRGILAFTALQAVSVVCAFFPVLTPVNLAIMYLTPFAALGILLPGIWMQMRRGQLPARLYLLGWIGFLVAFALNAAVFQGWVDYSAYFVYAPVFTAPVAFGCFALGAYRRSEADSREAALLRERFAELSRQLAEPERAARTSAPANDVSSDASGDADSQRQRAAGEADDAPAAGRQSQLGGVDVTEKKRLLLEAMHSERLYELEDLRLEVLARHVDLRPHQLSELLNQDLKVSFSEFVRKFRIDAACDLLADPTNEDSVLQIGYAVGFGSKTAFNRSFTELVGVTPGRYRNQARRA